MRVLTPRGGRHPGAGDLIRSAARQRRTGGDRAGRNPPSVYEWLPKRMSRFASGPTETAGRGGNNGSRGCRTPRGGGTAGTGRRTGPPGRGGATATGRPRSAEIAAVRLKFGCVRAG